MFHLASGIPLSVDVADLFQLERPLHSDGILQPATQEKEIFVAIELLCQALVIPAAMHHLPGQVWQPREGRKEPAHPFPINHPALLAHITREQIERADCRDVCLCARHADLRPASRVDNAVRDSSSLAANNIADRDLRAIFFLGHLHGGQRIHRLTRLRERNEESFRTDDRFAVAHLRGVLDLSRYAGNPLDVVSADHRRVKAGAHAH